MTSGQSEFSRKGTPAPAALIFGLLTNTRLHLAPNLGIMFVRSPRTGGISQPLQAVNGKRLPPLADGDRRNLQGGGYCPVNETVGCRQHDATALGQRLRHRGGMGELVESAAGLSAQLHGQRNARHALSIQEVRLTIKNYLYDVLVLLCHKRLKVQELCGKGNLKQWRGLRERTVRGGGRKFTGWCAGGGREPPANLRCLSQPPPSVLSAPAGAEQGRAAAGALLSVRRRKRERPEADGIAG